MKVDRVAASRATRPGSRASPAILPAGLGCRPRHRGMAATFKRRAAYDLPMTPPPAPTVDSFTSDVLSVEADGHVATLWLDREEKRNALGPAFWSDLPVAMAAISGDPDVRAVVIAARGGWRRSRG